MGQTRRMEWMLVFVCVLPLLGFWAYGLFDLDEGFYAAVVRDMSRRNNWVTPTISGAPWFEKPILAYWLAIPSVRAFGDCFGPRLPSVLSTLLTCLVTFRTSLKLFGRPAAVGATVALATNLLAVGIGRMMMTDAPLVLCLTAAFAVVLLALHSGRRPTIFEWAVCGVAVGLGVLAKGPVALVLFGGVLVTASVWDRSLAKMWRSWWPIGLVCSVIVAACWYWPCYQANGDLFVKEFLIEQNVGRFSGGDKAHRVPTWAHPVYFPVVLLVSFLPWYLVKSGTVRHILKFESATDRFVAAWFFVPLVFFTVSGTKLPHYILPAVVPAAILLGRHIGEGLEDRLIVRSAIASVLVLVAAQSVFTLDWNGRMEPVQTLAMKMPPGSFVYRITERGDGPFGLRQTSHPSIHFYAKGQVNETEDASTIRPGAVVLLPKSILETDPQFEGSRMNIIDQKGGLVLVKFHKTQ